MERNRARASPGSDALQRPLAVVENRQRVPQNPRLRPKKLVENKNQKKKRRIRIGSWNIGSLTGKGREVVDVMQRRDIKILCVQETKWKGKSAKKIGEGYKVYYSGENARRNGVGVILHPELQENVTEVVRVNDRLIGLKLISDGKMWHIISTYAPQQGCRDEEKEEYREKLEEYLESIPRTDMLVVGGDMNAHVGENCDGYDGVHGGKGFGRRNIEGERILELAEAIDLIILNTWFKKRKNHLITYKSGGNETQIDYFMIRKEERRLAMDCKVIPGEPVVTQHRLLVADFRLKRERKKKKKEKKRKIKTWELKGEKVMEFRNKVEEARRERYENGRSPDSAEEIWTGMKDIVVTKATEVCGRTSGNTRLEEDTWWWNEEVQNPIKEKKLAYQQTKDNEDDITLENYRRTKREAKRAVAKAKWDACKELYDKLDTPEGEKIIYRIAKTRNEKRKDVGEIGIIKDENGNILIEEREIKQRWQEYFSILLNTENEYEELSEALPIEGPVQNVTRAEVDGAIRSGKKNKAGGKSEVTIDLVKALGEMGQEWIHSLLEKIWETEMKPKDWEESEMIKFYKQKGDILNCENYRGIKLLEHVLKILERVIEGRLRELVPIHRHQFGFMSGKSTMDAIFIVRQIQEKYLEGNKKVYWCFVDLEKAYDRVPREVLYWCLRKRGVPEKIVRLVKMTYDGAKTTVRTKYGKTEPFPVEVGLHQGSALSPFLFLIVLDTITREVREEDELWELLFADDLVIVADTEEELQQRFLTWRDSLERRGMKVNTRKTEVMVSSREGNEDINITAEDGQVIEQTREFKYLGSILTEEGGTEKAVRQRIKVVWQKWREVSGVILDRRMPLKLRMKIYKTVLRPVLLYGAETWSLRKKEEDVLERTEMRMVRWIAGISLLERRESEDIRKMCGICNIKEKAREARLRYYGHVIRRDDDEPVKKAMMMPVRGRRSVGRQRIRWSDVVSRDMNKAGVQDDDAMDRNRWKRMTRAADPAIVWE